MKKIIRFFQQYPSVAAAISTRQIGDCRPLQNPQNWQNVQKFLNHFRLNKNNLVLAEQIHSNGVKIVGKSEEGKTIPGVDGLVTKEKGIILGIRTADCLPILLYDPVAKIIGAAHAGWKGILSEIPQNLVKLAVANGARPQNILIAIGPHIGGCCYNIEANRAKAFEQKFGHLKNMLINRGKKLYLDLNIPIAQQLTEMGIPNKNINISPICTSCQSNRFFSYRKDSNQTFGEMLSIISKI